MNTFPSYKLRESRCPTCGYKLDGATKAHGEEAAPEQGDTSICLNCGEVLKYEADLTLRKATAAEMKDLTEQPEAWATVENARLFIWQRGRFA